MACTAAGWAVVNSNQEGCQWQADLYWLPELPFLPFCCQLRRYLALLLGRKHFWDVRRRSVDDRPAIAFTPSRLGSRRAPQPEVCGARRGVGLPVGSEDVAGPARGDGLG